MRYGRWCRGCERELGVIFAAQWTAENRSNSHVIFFASVARIHHVWVFTQDRHFIHDRYSSQHNMHFNTAIPHTSDQTAMIRVPGLHLRGIGLSPIANVAISKLVQYLVSTSFCQSGLLLDVCMHASLPFEM